MLGLLLGCLSLLLCQLQVGPNHILQRLDIHLKTQTQTAFKKTASTILCEQTSLVSLADLLADVLILVEALLGQMALAEIHAELQVFEHNGLVDLLPCSMFLAFDDIV